MKRLLAILCVATVGGCGSSLFNKESSTTTPAAAKLNSAPNAADVPAAPPARINPATYYAAGQLHEREGNLAAALEQYTRATEADARYVPAWNRLGMVYDKLRMFDKAENAFVQALSLAPGQAFVQNNVGFHYMLAGNFPRAESALRAALASKPNYARARMNLAVVLTRTGRVEEAVETFTAIIPRDMAYYNVGVLCAADQRYDEARNAFVSAISINPSSSEARAQLDQINRMSGTADVAECAAAIRATQSLAASIGAAEDRLGATEFDSAAGAPTAPKLNMPAAANTAAPSPRSDAWPTAPLPAATQPTGWKPIAVR